MAASKGIRKVCSNGHVFYKSSDCPVCPVCKKEKKPVSSFLAEVPAPARRALERENLNTLARLSKKTEKELAGLHGMGPKAIAVLKKALKAKGMSFKK